QSRVAAVWNGSPGGNSAITSSYQAQSGTGTSVGLTSTGYGFVVGGDFHEIWNGTAWVERRGLFACSTTGLNSWQYNILDPQVTGEAVRAVSWWGASWNWVGGNFSLSDPDNFRRIDAP